MTSPRTRSLSELPGHLRVPILRRKDTQRTRERLAAGVAGMEELRSLRQHQQQIVGKTVAKAEDKRQERRSYGGVDRSPAEDAFQSASGQQTPLHSPRHPVPHPRSYFFGQSMDSILEEGDGLTSGWLGDPELTGSGHQLDVNNNDNNDNNKKTNDPFNKSPSPDHYKSDSKSKSWSSDYLPSPTYKYDLEKYSASPNQKHVHQISGKETKHHSTQSPYNNNELYPDANPLRSCNEIDTPVSRKLLHSPTFEDKNTKPMNAPIPARRRSLSSRPCHDPKPVVSLRQRSSSIDMGQEGMKSSPHLLPQPFMPKKGNIHNRFSSLTSINNAYKADENQLVSDTNSKGIDNGHRLSQSMTQINNVGIPRTNTLKRRGSLTWDSLLKSIGIQDPSNSTPDSENQNSETHREQNNNNNNGIEKGMGSEKPSIDQPSNSEIPMSRKKGRSMSFTCCNSTPLINPTNYRMNQTRQNAVARYNDNDDDDDQPEMDKKNDSSAQMNTTPRSIHPILRRASIQCEAVLTNSSRVVNPIQDVDVNRFNSPGPLHAVMLQYQGYKNSPSIRTDSVKSSTSTSTKPVTRVSGTQGLSSSECLSGVQTNTVNHRNDQCSKNSPDLAPDQQRVGEVGVIGSGSATPGKQDQACCNVTQKDKHNASLEGNVNGDVSNSATEQCCNEDNVSVSKEAIKHLDASLDVSKSPIAPDLAKQIETSQSKNSLEAVEGESIMSVCQNLSDVDNKHAPHRAHDELSSTGKGSRDSSREVTREMAHGHEYTTTASNPTSISNYRCDCLTTSRESSSDSDKNKPNYPKGYEQKHLPSHNKFVPNSDDYVFENNSNKQRNINGCIPNRGADTMYGPIQDQRKESESEYSYNVPGKGCNISHSASLKLPKNDSEKQCRSIPPSEARTLYNNQHSPDDMDVIRNKRSSIFSDVSVISDFSNKTPSSSASVLSDFSMVSDEGYNTCESTSPDGKMTHLKRLSSMSSCHSTVQYPNISSSECLIRDKRGTKSRDQNGNDVLHYMSKDRENLHDNDYFRNENEGRPAPIVHVKPLIRQSSTNLNDNQQRSVYRKPIKQTTV